MPEPATQTRHLILLHDRDQRERIVRVAVRGLAGAWKVSDALGDILVVAMAAEQIGSTGTEVNLGPTGPAVLLLQHPLWSQIPQMTRVAVRDRPVLAWSTTNSLGKTGQRSTMTLSDEWRGRVQVN